MIGRSHFVGQLLRERQMICAITRSVVCRRACAFLALALFLLGASVTNPQAVRAQSKVMPNEMYYMAFRPFYGGEYDEALRGFREAAGGGLRDLEGRWIDSICYHTMTGECYYHMGNLTDALEHYAAALKLYVANPDWMLSVQFPRYPGRIELERSQLDHLGRHQARFQVGAIP